jgi:arylsulfatase A-like enzyme
MILATPEGGPRGVRVSEQVRLTDVAPTLLEALGVERELAGEGVSLLPLARGSKSTLPGPSISAIYASNADPYQRFLLAVRNGRWKSIWRKEGWANSDALWSPEGRELYDLQADPGELHSLAADQPGVWESLRDMAGQVQVELRSDQEHSAGALEALRDLGYVH